MHILLTISLFQLIQISYGIQILITLDVGKEINNNDKNENYMCKKG